jgi:predicted phosphodiesterase
MAIPSLLRAGTARARPLATAAAIVTFVLAAALGGTVLALQAYGRTTATLPYGVVAVSASPAVTGTAELYVPLVDWDVETRPFRAPVAIRAELRSVDRARLLLALRSGRDARTQVAEVRATAGPVVRRAMVRVAIVAVIGAVVGGLMAGLALAALTGRRRHALTAVAVSSLAGAAVIAASAWSVAHYDARALAHPTFRAHGDELPRLLAFSSQITDASRGYSASYANAILGASSLARFVGSPVAPGTAHEFMVGSDIHSNTLPLRAFGRYAQNKPVYLVGDFSQLGTSLELPVADAVAALGPQVVAVSGNHDTLPLMRRLAERGVTVLRSDGILAADGSVHGSPVTTIAGITVAGYTDPLEAASDRIGRHPLELQGAAFTAAAADLIRWFDALRPRPRMVLVHEHGLAHALLDHVAAAAPSLPSVLVLTGHDHVQHIEQEGGSLLLDGGTLGAGGVLAIGRAAAGFLDVRLDASLSPVSADMVAVDPVTGDGVARRVAFPTAAPGGRGRWDTVPAPTRR